MVKYLSGDLLEADVNYICHQVNCQGVMGAGIAKSIKQKWPEVFKDYYNLYENHMSTRGTSKNLLGCIQVVHVADKSIINMFAQEDFGRHTIQTNYSAFRSCLENIKYEIPTGSSIGFPNHIGCGLAGGNWTVISSMIEEILGKDFDVYIYSL